jgi:hypothetical protein
VLVHGISDQVGTSAHGSSGHAYRVQIMQPSSVNLVGTLCCACLLSHRLFLPSQ